MLYQPHMFSWYQMCQLGVWDIPVHAFACFWLADRNVGGIEFRRPLSITALSSCHGTRHVGNASLRCNCSSQRRQRASPGLALATGRHKKEAKRDDVRLTIFCRTPSLYRFRSVFTKVGFSAEDSSPSKCSLLEITSGTLVSAVPETSEAFTSDGLPRYWKCHEPLLP
jgi:hypothetical protein